MFTVNKSNLTLLSIALSLSVSLLCSMEPSNLRNTKAESDFIWAASQNNLDKVKELASLVDINVKDKKQSTALHWASFKGHFDVAHFLLSKGAGVNVTDNKGKTPLQYAAGHGHTDILTALLNHKALIDVQDIKGDTALHWATFNKYGACVKKLLEHHAHINSQNNAGIVPLHSALISGNADIVNLLLSKKPKLLSDNKDRNPMHFAAWGNNYSCLKSIIEQLPVHKRAALLNLGDYEGETALHYAAQNGNWPIAQLLIQQGADVNIQCKTKKRTPLHVCLRQHRGTVIHASSFEEMLEKKAKRLSTFDTLFFIAALKAAPHLDVTTKDYQGLSAYDCINKTKFVHEIEKNDIMDIVFNPTVKPLLPEIEN